MVNFLKNMTKHIIKYDKTYQNMINQKGLLIQKTVLNQTSYIKTIWF